MVSLAWNCRVLGDLCYRSLLSTSVGQVADLFRMRLPKQGRPARDGMEPVLLPTLALSLTITTASEGTIRKVLPFPLVLPPAPGILLFTHSLEPTATSLCPLLPHFLRPLSLSLLVLRRDFHLR